MKKLFNLILLSIMCFTLIGCSNKDKFADFEHYDLAGKDIISHTFVDDNRFQQTYVVADITPVPYEISVYGLFYKISSNDYILLDKMESIYTKDEVNKFYDDKLYVLGQGSTDPILEYKLNQEKTTKKELSFDFYKGFVPVTIKDIKKNNIYYSAYTNDDSTGLTIHINLECSLDSYKCKLIEE